MTPIEQRAREAAERLQPKLSCRYASQKINSEYYWRDIREIEQALLAIHREALEEAAQLAEEQIFRIGKIHADDMATAIRRLASPAPKEEPHG